MCLQMDRIDHQRVRVAAFFCQPKKHFCEDAFFAPPLPATVKLLVGPVFLRRIAPSQAIAINEDNAAQNPAVFNPGLTVGLGKTGLKLGQLRRALPV